MQQWLQAATLKADKGLMNAAGQPSGKEVSAYMRIDLSQLVQRTQESASP